MMDTMLDCELIFKEAYINGYWGAAGNSARFDVLSPSTGQKIASVADVGKEGIEQAIAAAYASWPGYRALTGLERARLLKRWLALIVQHKEQLATLIAMECGKVLAESRAEVDYGASYVEWFAEEAQRVYGSMIPAQTLDKRLLVTRHPVGVVATITPWNFPLAMITRKVAPALAVGCPVIVKPPSEAPLTALALAHLADLAGFNPGVYNTIPTTDSRLAARLLCEDSRVRKLSFTGSTPVGKQLMAQGAVTLKKLSLELGGNAPFIVFDDADIDKAVKGALVAKFRNNGQTCVCANRFFVQEKVHDVFVERFKAAVSTLRMGDSLDETVQLGPLINAKALSKVQQLVADAVGKGAEVVYGGRAGQGLFYEPTILRNVDLTMDIAHEEVFGPVAPILKFQQEEEVIQLANDTNYGLASYCYTQDLARCWRISEQLECGIVGINEGLVSTAVAPFGGVKESGFGREGSMYGLHDYTELKYTCFGGILGIK